MRKTLLTSARLRRASIPTLLLGAVLFTLPSAPLYAQVGNTAPQGASADVRQVMAVIHRLFDGMRAGDSGMVRSVFHPQLRMMTVARGPDGALRLNVGATADGFVKSVGTPHTPVWDERVWNEKVEIDGALASVWVDYAFYAGEKLSHCGVDHFLLVRGHDAKWTILSLADTRRTTGCTSPKASGGG